MRTIATTLALLALLLVPQMARSDDNNSNLSYNDPAVHYTAPDGWTKIDVPPDAKDAPTALFRKQFDRYDVRAITLKIQPYSGSLDGLESSHESELRSDQQNVFVDKKSKITLSNGMPAWQVKYSFGQEAGSIVRSYEYIAWDGKRSVILSYSGRAGDFSDKDALDAMSSLTVVLYPEGR